MRGEWGVREVVCSRKALLRKREAGIHARGVSRLPGTLGGNRPLLSRFVLSDYESKEDVRSFSVVSLP